MGKLFSRKDNSDNTEKPKDFILAAEDNESDNDLNQNTDNTTSEVTEESPETIYIDSDTDNTNNNSDNTNITDNNETEISQDTTVVNLAEVSTELKNKHKKKSNIFGRISATAKKNKVATICICSALAASIVAGAAWGVVSSANPLRNYVQAAAAKENIMYTLDVNGTLNPGDKYSIMSLVSGKITESDAEVGDTVKAGDVLYKLDDTEAKLSVERAKNELDKAKNTKTTSTSTDTGRIIATDKGTVQTLNIKQGSSVTAGSQVGTLKKEDNSVVPIVSYVSGTVSVLSVQTGREVSNNQLIASVKLTNAKDSNSNNTEYDKKSSEIDVQAAQKQLEYYTIKSPTDGVVIEKNNRVGDNIGTADSYKPLMVVMDTSSLTLTCSVPEDQVKDVEKGNSVTITTPSVPDTTFSGEVSYVSLEGNPKDDGKVYFDVIITISEPGDLKAGMTANANIILSSVKNTLSVPQNALLKTDGQNALVLVKSEDDGDDKDISESTENAINNPEIKIPDGCELKSVKYGISDGTNVQILSGLKLGDIVVYSPKNDGSDFIKSTAKNSNTSSKKSSKSSDLTDDDSKEDSKTDSNNDSDNESDEDVKQEVKDKVNSILGNI